MQFELTDALLNDIIFSMEDQDGNYMLDTVEGVVTGGMDELDSINAESFPRYIPLPEWDSSSGFNLMERFASSLRNPLVQEQLSSSLNQGRGVFRAFKNTLAQYPEAEKLWFSFKEKEMKKEVIMWYNGLREEWGLEEIGAEPEDTGDLVLEDFRFRPFRNEDIVQAAELHSQCVEDFKKTMKEAGFSGLTPKEDTLSFDSAMTAVSLDDKLAGYICGEKTETVFHIRRLEVKTEFRGLGIGETLLVKFLESLNSREIDHVLVDLPASAEAFSRVLRRESFKPYMVKYSLNLRDWGE